LKGGAGAAFASRHSSARAEPLKRDKSRAEALVGHRSDLEASHEARGVRTEPVSIHLMRHRDCLERQRAGRRGPAATADDRDDKLGQSPFGRTGRPGATLPFGRQDDGE